MSDQPGSNGTSRLDRMEGLMELLIVDHLKFRDEHLQLLKAQVLLADHAEKMDQRVDRLVDHADQLDERLTRNIDAVAASIRELTEAQKHTDDRLNALINVVDDVVRKRPNA